MLKFSWWEPDNFPFPIPLKKNGDGKWFFDTAAGKEEVLNRRIGRNELAIIAVCGAAVDAQGEYFSKPHDGQHAKQFAAKFISDPGKQNGLYWKPAKASPQARSVRWRPSQPLKDTAKSRRATPHSTATTSVC